MANAFTQTPTGKKITIVKRKADLQKVYSVGPDHVMVFEDGEKILIEDGANLLLGDEEFVVEFADQAVPGRELFGQAERVAQANVGDALRAGITEINIIPVTLTSAAVGVLPLVPLGVFGGAVGVVAAVDNAGTSTPETTPGERALAAIGADADDTNTTSEVTVAQLNTISGISGTLEENEAAYQAYIDANPDAFSAPATVAEVNAMITAVNAAVTASNSVLTQIGTEGDNPDTTDSVVTAAQLSSIIGVSGVEAANEAAYQAYIDANPDAFSAPATVAEVNAMITAVNAAVTASNSVLAQIGTEGDNPDTTDSVVTAAQLSSIIGVSGVEAANEAAYQAYIDANPDAFSAPATVAEVNAMITAVNAAVTASRLIQDYAENNSGTEPVATDYSDIGVMGLGDGATAPSVAQVNSVLVSAAVVGSEVDTATEVQNIVDAYQSLLDLADGADGSGITLTDIDVTALGLDGVVTDAANAQTLSLLTDAFDRTAPSNVANHSAITSIAQTVANIMAIAAGGSGSVTQAELEAIGLTDLTPARAAHLLTTIAASADDGSDVDTVDKLQAMVDVTAPTLLSITDNVTAAVATGPITYTFNFSEDVGTSFTFDDITVSGDAVVSDFTQVNATTYTAIVTPRGTDTLSVSVAAGKFSDLVENANSSLAAAADQDYSVIMLGAYGRLIHGVEVDGAWYYVYDRNGDGVHNDLYSMTNLEKIFYGTATGNVITESNRQAVIEGVTLWVPTDGRSGSTVAATPLTGTVVNDPSASNSVFDDLAAIWDAFNGDQATSGTAGIPPGWASGNYWAATPATTTNTHGVVSLTNGTVSTQGDGSTNYVAFQVIL